VWAGEAARSLSVSMFLSYSTFTQHLNIIVYFSNADTEGSFIVKRVVDIADAAVKHMQHVVESSDMDEAGAVLNIRNADKIRQTCT